MHPKKSTCDSVNHLLFRKNRNFSKYDSVVNYWGKSKGLPKSHQKSFGDLSYFIFKLFDLYHFQLTSEKVPVRSTL